MLDIWVGHFAGYNNVSEHTYLGPHMCILFIANIETINFLSQAIYPSSPGSSRNTWCQVIQTLVTAARAPGPHCFFGCDLCVPGPRSVVTSHRVHTMMDVTLPHTSFPPFFPSFLTNLDKMAHSQMLWIPFSQMRSLLLANISKHNQL